MQILVNAKETRVNTFLNSVGRNSKKTKITYNTGLVHFAEYLKPRKQTPDSIIAPLQTGKLSVYELLDQFVSYLSQQSISVPSIRLYLAAVKSYLEYNDIDISSSKFKRRVKMPKFHPDPEEPLSIQDIRELINQCRNERLACYLLLLTSTGLRATEAASLRLKDIDFTVSPTRITIRKETTKTKCGRVIYCSDEATKQIRILMEQQKRNHTAKRPDDLLFTIQSHTKHPKSIYEQMLRQFERLQEKMHKDQKKDNSKRNKITLHSFRRTAFTIINEQTNSEYAHYYLGHSHSVYFSHSEEKRREIYAKRCMSFLTVLDYTLLDTQQKNIQAELQVKDKQIQELTRRLDQQAQRLDMQEAFLRNPEKFIKMRDEAFSMGKKKN